MTILLRLLLAFLAALLPVAPRPAQPVEVSVWPWRQVAPATAGRTGAPLGVTPSLPAVPRGASEPIASVPAPTAEIGSAMIGTASSVTFEGTLSYVGARFGPRYLALPEKVGTRARICGPAACVTRISTDYGPDQRVNPDRIADLSATDWLAVCGVPLSFGLCPGTVTLVGLPATDSGGER